MQKGRRYINFKQCLGIALVLTLFIFYSACSACRENEDEPVQVGSDTVTLKNAQAGKKALSASEGTPKVRVIDIGPSKEEPTSSSAKSSENSLPREVSVDDRLTARLKDKLKEAFEGRGIEPPQIEIFTGVINLDAFAKYYEDQGYKIQRTSVPASQIVAPLLDEKPELSDKINLANFAGININQVIVEGINISAADKYIDPETYEIVYKTFVTVTQTK